MNTLSAFAGPNRTTYQAKIVKPDGYPLESSSVNFKFTILDPAGSCILYSETYSSVNMSSTGGLISFSLGSGVKTYPVSATTFEQVFSNITPSLSCDAGGPPSYSPASSDARKIVMQFHDGAGWQTLPAMSINAVPYAMYANESLKLNGKSDTDFVQVAAIPACLSTEALQYNGTSFLCVSTSVSAAAVVAALGYTPADGASVTALSSSLSTTDATVAAVSSTVASVSSEVFSVSSTVSTLQNTVAASFAAITSSQWITSGAAIYHNAGFVGIGITTPVTKLDVSGGVRISMESAACAVSFAGTLRYNSGLVEYCDGTAWSAFGVAGAGITLFNGSSSGTQTFATGITGTVFNISTNNGVHTFNIPLAASSSVTAGLLSNADYVSFSNKLNATSAAVITAMGYTPANSATVSTLGSNLAAVSTSAAAANTNVAAVSSTVAALQTSVTSLTSTTAASFAAITSSQWVTSGSTINYSAGNVGIGTNNPTNPLHLAGSTLYTAMTIDSLSNKQASYLFAKNGVTKWQFGMDFAADGTSDWYVYDQTNAKARIYIDPTGNINFGAGATNAYGGTSSLLINSIGNVGIGTTAPVTKLEVSGGVRISMEAASCAAGLAGTLRYNAGNVEYCNGTSWSAFGVAGAGITLVNGSASGSQTFATGITGTVFNITTVNGVHTFNIPLAASSSVTAGLLSNADYTTFTNKLNATSAAVISALGYTPANNAASGTYVVKTNNLSDLTSATVARTNLGLGSVALLNYIDLSGAQVSGTLAAARLPAFSGDASSSAGSAVLTLASVGAGVTSGSQYTKVTVDGKGRVTSGAQLTSSDVTTALGYSPASASAATQWSTSGTTISYSAGNVGIGTSNPSYKLDVNGDLNVSGTIRTISGSNGTPGITFGDLDTGFWGAGSNVLFQVNSSNSLKFLSTGIEAANVVGFKVDNNGAGTAAAPTYTWQGANGAGTGIFNPATKVLAISTSSTERMRIDSTGNVGIGTNAPQMKLQVASGPVLIGGNISGYSTEGIIVNSSSQRSDISFMHSTTGLTQTSDGFNMAMVFNNVDFDLRENGYMRFLTNSSERVRITSTGNMGIGIVAPTARLHLASGTTSVAPLRLTSSPLLTTAVSGAIEYDGTSLYYTDDTNTRRVIAANTSSGTYTNVSNINSSGNISLTPTGSVVVSSTTASTNSSTGALIVQGGLGVAGNINASGNITTTANIQGVSITATNGIISPYIAGGVASGGNITIDSTTDAGKGNIYLAPNGGKVGIGYNSPGGKLHIGGSLSGGYRSWMDNGMLVGKSGDSDGGYFGLKDEGLNRQDTVIAWGDDAADILRFIHTASGGASDGVEVMRVTPAGNVGIGVTNPTQQLTTSGNVLVGSNQYPAVFMRDTSWWVGILRQAQTSWPDADSFVFSTPTGRPFVFQSGAASQTEGTPLVYIDTSGSVGIGGVTTPLERLDVSGNVHIRGQNIYMSHDGGVNTNNDYMTYDDGTFLGTGGIFAFNADTTRTVSWTAATAAIAAKAGYFVNNISIGTSATTRTLEVNGSINAGGMVAETFTFAIDGTINGTWALGSLSNGGQVEHVTFEMYVHNNSTIDALKFQVSLPTYSNGTFYSGWQELPVVFGSSAWNGQKNYVVDVLRSSASAGQPLYFRVRNKNGNGSASTMKIRMTYNSDATFTRITHVDTVGTAFNATTNAAGGPVDGMYGALEYSFPVAAGQAWRPADNTGLFVKNSGYVGIGTGSPISQLHVASGPTMTAGYSRNLTLHAQHPALQFKGISDTNHSAGIGYDAEAISEGMRFWVGATSDDLSGTGRLAMNITANGSVGIGTMTPSEKLEVSGSVKATAYLYTSDERLKKEIITLPDALTKALQLRGVNFVWKNNNEKTVGFIAQEVEAVYPELVKTDKVTGYKAVQYGNIVAILVEALKQEHEERVRSVANVAEKSEVRMNQLEKENQDLKARLEKLEKFFSDRKK